MVVMVASTLWAAKYSVPKRLARRVKISKANHSASTMTIPGKARRTMTPQLDRALRLNPPQHWLPSTKRTNTNSSIGSSVSVTAMAMGAPTKP